MASEGERAKIVYVYGEGDWEGLYINGRLKYQGHSIHPVDFAKALGIKLEALYVDDNWMRSHGILPKNLCDVECSDD